MHVYYGSHGVCVWYVEDRICVQVEWIELTGSIVCAQVPMNDWACVFALQ